MAERWKSSDRHVMAPHLAAGWQFGLPLDVGAEQSIAMRRQATTRATYNAQSPSPCRPLASGGVVSVTADAVVGEGGTHAKTYRQSIDRALESRRPDWIGSAGQAGLLMTPPIFRWPRQYRQRPGVREHRSRRPPRPAVPVVLS